MANRRTYNPRHTPGPPRITPASVQGEVVANIKAQRLGPATVADLNLPESFITQVAGRTLQTWFHERFRIVVDDTGAGLHQEPVARPRGKASGDQAPLHIIQAEAQELPVAVDAPALAPPSRNFSF